LTSEHLFIHNRFTLIYFDSFQFILPSMPKINTPPKHPIQLRLPVSVFDSLQARAAAENRSLNAMANMLLAQVLTQSGAGTVQSHSTFGAAR
jgi:hypothetical protein